MQEIGLTGELGLPVVKHVELGQGIVHVCVTIPLQLTVEQLAKVTQVTQKLVWFAIVQVSRIELTLDLNYTVKIYIFSDSVLLLSRSIQ